MSVKVDGLTVEITTNKLEAKFYGPKLVSLKDNSGRSLIKCSQASGPEVLELVFVNNEVQPLGQASTASISAIQISDTVAHIHVNDIEGDAILRISTDAEGRLLLEPSAHTARPGLSAIRLNLCGICKNFNLIAPLFQGCSQDLEDPIIAFDEYEWPMVWEAAIAILQSDGFGFSIHTEDRKLGPKKLLVGHEKDARTLGFVTDSYGPWDRNCAVGSLVWIIDTHIGNWKKPASVYRSWMNSEFNFDNLRSLRPDWFEDIRLAVQWCCCEKEILDRLEKFIDPSRVLIHVPSWRSDLYDVNYPEYTANEESKKFIKYAIEKGFKIAPHFNYFAIDPKHPAFLNLKEFVLREPDSKRLKGWRWKDADSCSVFPQGYKSLRSLSEECVMAYLHAGSSAWRRIFLEKISSAVNELNLQSVFIDQTLCTPNADNALVENLSTIEGMHMLMRDICSLKGSPAICGEGLNEINMRYQSFAQTHLFKSHRNNCDHFENLNPVPVGHFLYGDLCRSMGYSNIIGDTAESEQRLMVHEKLLALPSLLLRTTEPLKNPSSAVKRQIERATS